MEKESFFSQHVTPPIINSPPLSALPLVVVPFLVVTFLVYFLVHIDFLCLSGIAPPGHMLIFLLLLLPLDYVNSCNSPYLHVS